MADYDAIVIGAGHNGLVSAAYLAQAGERVLVVERFERPGGCVATEEIPGFPGSQVDVGGLEHGAFAAAPVMRELDLARHGLRYLQHEHTFTFIADGASWILHRDAQKTRASITALSPRDGETWPRFADFAEGVLRVLSAIGDAPPPSFPALLRLMSAGGRRADTLMRTFLASPRQVVDGWFESEPIRAGLINQATHAQTPPWQLGSGYAPFLALGGQGGKRPEGGGKSLIRALVSCLEQHGGTLRCEAPVRRILVDERRALGVELESGERITARHAVVSAIDARRVFTRLIDAHHVPAAFRRRMEALTSGRDNIGELSMAAVLDDLPPLAMERVGSEAYSGAFWHSGSVQDIEETFLDIRRGELPRRPSLMWAVPSVLDPSLAPPGKQLLWLAAFLPYRFRDGRGWDEMKEEAADLLLAQVDAAAPGLRRRVVARTVLSPLDWERRTGNLCGNADHLDTGIDQMLGNRPSPSIARYRTPIRGLYLTGAGTHPGGGITGQPGRNTARVALGDLGLLQRPALQQVAQRAERLRELVGAARALRRVI
jgi:phytoene dehydrogenase-like protein